MSLTITHTHAAGTLIDGTSRGDGSAEVLKTVVNPYTGRPGAWRWSRNLDSWYVARSRDTRANTALFDATKAALEAAGFTVDVEIDDACRPAAEVEADAVARQEDRVAALGAKAERSAGAAYAAEDRARELAARMPLGQPILVGHHSEARIRKAYANIENASRASVAAYGEAKTAEARAAAASTTTAFRYSPGVIRRRIERLEADLRRCERARDGHTRTLFTDCRGVKQVETHGAAEGAHRERVLADIARPEDQNRSWSARLQRGASGSCRVVWHLGRRRHAAHTRRDGVRTFRQGFVTRTPRHHRVLVANRTDARARWRDHSVTVGALTPRRDGAPARWPRRNSRC